MSALAFSVVGGLEAVGYNPKLSIPGLGKAPRRVPLTVLQEESRAAMGQNSCFVAGTDVLEGDGRKADIETVRVGQRVATDGGLGNSGKRSRTPDATEVDADSWRKVTIHAEQTWADGTRDEWDVETLQPVGWLAQYGVDVGGWIDLSAVLDLKEMGTPEGLRGRVTAVGGVPAIAAGPGRVVLTTVNHLSDFVFRLSLQSAAGALDTLGVTGWHKFFSEDRDAWVSACELNVGETIRGHDGDVVVAQLLRDPGVRRVYNMTVEADHVYYVGGIEVLAHNTCPARSYPPGLRSGFSNGDFGTEVHQRFEGALHELTGTIKGDWEMRTGVGQLGIDATYVGPRSRYPGFKHAELKPNTYPAFETFGDQLTTWRQQGLRGEVQLFFYDESGIIGSSGINYR